MKFLARLFRKKTEPLYSDIRVGRPIIMKEVTADNEHKARIGFVEKIYKSKGIMKVRVPSLGFSVRTHYQDNNWVIEGKWD